MINIFVKNLQELYKENRLSVTLLKRLARSDKIYGDITEEDYDYFIEWIEEQENPKEIEEIKNGIKVIEGKKK